jgi:hypothetical protein
MHVAYGAGFLAALVRPAAGGRRPAPERSRIAA